MFMAPNALNINNEFGSRCIKGKQPEISIALATEYFPGRTVSLLKFMWEALVVGCASSWL
jgi:hypothetical protein